MKKILIIIVINIASIKSAAQDYGSWSPAAELNDVRYLHAAIVLEDGNVLVTGGELAEPSCEIYNVTDNTWTYTTSMNFRRANHAIVKLLDNRILVIGGRDVVKGIDQTSCEIFDPVTKTWELTDSIKQYRSLSRPTITLLNDGRVLIAGGFFIDENWDGHYLTLCEIYTPETGRWELADSLNFARSTSTATKLKDGRVLVVGGFSKVNGYMRYCEIYDPVLGKWTIVDSLKTGRSDHSSLLLPDGKVFVSGGSNNPLVGTNELYDPSLNKWFDAGYLSTWGNSSAELISDSVAMLLNGSGYWELYDLKKFETIYFEKYQVYNGSEGEQKKYASEVLQLENGNILSIGGLIRDGMLISTTKECELYTPGVTGIDEVNIIPNEIRLAQNYPNPFNPSTVINYYLPVSGFITLKVYDVLGNEIEPIDKGYKQQGNHKVVFNASRLSSGVYIYKLNAGKISVAKKMLLLR